MANTFENRDADDHPIYSITSLIANYCPCRVIRRSSTDNDVDCGHTPVQKPIFSRSFSSPSNFKPKPTPHATGEKLKAFSLPNVQPACIFSSPPVHNFLPHCPLQIDSNSTDKSQDVTDQKCTTNRSFSDTDDRNPKIKPIDAPEKLLDSKPEVTSILDEDDNSCVEVIFEDISPTQPISAIEAAAEVEREIWSDLSPCKSESITFHSGIALAESNEVRYSYAENVFNDIFPTLLEFRFRRFQKFTETMRPLYRMKPDNATYTAKKEIYVVMVGRKKSKCKKIGTVDTTIQGGRFVETDGTLVHEFQFVEEPQFVEVMQPPTPTRNMPDIESDGRILDVDSDPPGQQSHYIRPGDINREAYRLSTYEQFSNRSSVDIAQLARYGFYYTGYFDRVRCFSCGRTVEKWQARDNPADKKWHRTDCLIAQGQACGNIQIGGNLLGNFFQNMPQTQAMEVGPSQPINQTLTSLPVRQGVDVADRMTGAGGTFNVGAGNTLIIQNGHPFSISSQPARSGNALGSSQAGNSPPSNGNPPREWRMANVISSDHRRHLVNLYLNRELDRLASFARWPTGRPNVSPAGLARAGFFYLGDMDRTQCFSCGGVLRNWTVEDDAGDEHRVHFPSCPFITGTEHRNVPIPTAQESQQDLSRNYPCKYPSNPHMRSQQSRLGTFDRRWQRNRTRASPEEITEAGFFFLGERDRVKCWYCNGGLQNWEYDDVPWIEHAKWFPNCQFLLQRQGQLFVYRYLSLSPHLPRPIIGRQDGSPADLTGPVGAVATPPDVQRSGARARAPSPPPVIIDPQEEMRKRKERVDKEIRDSDNVKMVIAFGYDEQIVRRVLEDHLESGIAVDGDSIFDGTASLLDAVMEKQKEIENEQEIEQATEINFPSISSIYSMATASSMETAPSLGPGSGLCHISDFPDSDDEEGDLYGSIAETPSALAASSARSTAEITRYKKPKYDFNIPEDPESIKNIIEQKKEERLCKICFTEVADMVFIPCSHMVCCRSCTEAIRHCPVCRKKIEKAIRTYVE